MFFLLFIHVMVYSNYLNGIYNIYFVLYDNNTEIKTNKLKEWRELIWYLEM